MPAFTCVMICWKRSAPSSVWQCVFYAYPIFDERKSSQIKVVRRQHRCGVDELFPKHSQYIFYNDLSIRFSLCLISGEVEIVGLVLQYHTN